MGVWVGGRKAHGAEVWSNHNIAFNVCSNPCRKQHFQQLLAPTPLHLTRWKRSSIQSSPSSSSRSLMRRTPGEQGKGDVGCACRCGVDSAHSV